MQKKKENWCIQCRQRPFLYSTTAAAMSFHPSATCHTHSVGQNLHMYIPSTLYIYSNIMLHTHYDRLWHELFESVAITGSFFSNVGFKQQNIIVMWVNCFSKRVELPTGLFGLTLSVVHYQLLTALLFQLVQPLCFIHLNSKCCFEPTCSMY